MGACCSGWPCLPSFQPSDPANWVPSCSRESLSKRLGTLAIGLGLLCMALVVWQTVYAWIGWLGTHHGWLPSLLLGRVLAWGAYQERLAHEVGHLIWKSP